MEYFITLPMELQSVIGSEKVDFTVLAKRNQPLKKSIGLMIFGTVWTAFTSIFVIAFLGPLFMGKETHFTVNGVPTTGSWDKTEIRFGFNLSRMFQLKKKKDEEKE